uniref:Cytochrome b5 heme-binding domain-containing protein n=1 Tax=Rhabditophanes sp. KR3021 TaxID=114890 RepID=A0AC35TPA8_9BILA
MAILQRVSTSPDLYAKLLILFSIWTAIVSCLVTYYDVDIPVGPCLKWIAVSISQIGVVKNSIERVEALAGFAGQTARMFQEEEKPVFEDDVFVIKHSEGLPILTKEQLSLFDGSRPSKPVCLAILGRIYDVSRGIKHYGPGGSYHPLAGKDATRAFVTGDLTEDGLIDDIEGLNDQDLLSIFDWIKFYEKDYKLVGYLNGKYFNAKGERTKEGEEAMEMLDKAVHFRSSQIEEYEAFPPCNSEFHQNTGGRVWCSNKSGGINRDWVGVPRKLFQPSSKSFRCACVKNFGDSLVNPETKGNRGDLDYAHLGEYDNCSPTSNSCRLIK